MLGFRLGYGMSFFGISFNSSGLPGGNIYLNLALIGIAGIVGCGLSHVFMNRIGRRHFIFITAFSSGVFILVATFLPKGKTLL